MKKKNDRLILKLTTTERHKHNVAMVNEEEEWNRHESNSGMGRMFFVMLLIHVVVIGGIIIYDWLNGEEGSPSSIVITGSSTSANALPPPALNAADVAAQIPIENCATYEWRSGDSISSVAQKLGVGEEVLIRMNMLDKGTQLEANSIIRYPKQPVVKALGLNVAGVDGSLPVVTAHESTIASAEVPMALAMPGEQAFSFQPTIGHELAPTPGATSVAFVSPSVQNSPPSNAGSLEVLGESLHVKPITQHAPPTVEPKFEPSELHESHSTPAKQKAMTTPIKKADDGVPKAIPVPRKIAPMPDATHSVKKRSADGSSTKLKTYTVRPNETLYGIASRHGVTVKALQDANKISRPELLRDGMKIVIPIK